MTGKFKRTTAAVALAVSLSMAAAPALARDGWGGRYHKRDRVDGGDILAGILIIGGIAAIASAASKAKKEREQLPRDYPDEPVRADRSDYGRPDNRPEWREGSGIDMAVNRCIDEINRGRERVGEVESVNRDAEGWRITGTTTGKGNFSCTIDRDGRIRNVNIDGQAI